MLLQGACHAPFAAACAVILRRQQKAEAYVIMGRSTAARANGWVSWKAGSIPLHLLLGALLLTSVALLYGRPFIFHDSGTYLYYGAHIVDEIGSLLRGVPPIVHLDEFELDYFGARSPTYSALL